MIMPSSAMPSSAAPIVHYSSAVVPAVTEVVASLRASLGGVEPALLACFVTSRADVAALSAALAAAFPTSVVVLSTTCGELGANGCTDGGLSVAALLPPCRASAVLVPRLSALRFEAGAGVVAALAHDLGLRPSELRPQRHVLLTLTDGLSGAEERLLATLTEHAPGIPLVGGSAGDDFAFVRTQVALGAEHGSDAAVVVLLEPNVGFHAFHLHHYAPTERELVVTSADPARRSVRRLDGYPVLRVLAELLEVSEAKLASEPQRLLQARPPVFGFRAAGALHLRSVMNVEDGALLLGGAVEVGTILRPMRPGDLIAATADGVKAALSAFESAAGMLLFNCGGRMWEARAQGRVGELAQAMQLHRASGFTTYGEQFGPLQVNHTLTGLVLGSTHG